MSLFTDEQLRFINAFNSVAADIHKAAVSKGWWDAKRNDAEMIALCHSELSEALEFLRNGNKFDDKIPFYLGVEAELADVIIRIMDMAEGRGWRVAEALEAKIDYNKTRERKHGKAF